MILFLLILFYVFFILLQTYLKISKKIYQSYSDINIFKAILLCTHTLNYLFLYKKITTGQFLQIPVVPDCLINYFDCTVHLPCVYCNPKVIFSYCIRKLRVKYPFYRPPNNNFYYQKVFIKNFVHSNLYWSTVRPSVNTRSFKLYA